MSKVTLCHIAPVLFLYRPSYGRCVLAEPTFSSPASTTRKLAEHMSVWMPKHLDDVCVFESKLIHMLSSCLQVRQTTQKAGREKMWSVILLPVYWPQHFQTVDQELSPNIRNASAQRG